MPVCPGCDQPFTHCGYTNHIQQSQSAACHAIFEDQNSYVPGPQAEPLETVSTPPFSPTHLRDNFGEDFFEPEFRTAEDHGFGPQNQESDSDEEFDNPGGWEPNPDPPPSDGDPMEDVQQNSAEHDNQQRRQMAEDRIRPAGFPLTVRKFAGRAGEIIDRVDAAGYSSYRGGDDTNIWAPFSSRTDWEVARWAKLRGPGSTSFSELLDIAGVR